ncbi:MAG: D-alanyl-D-alanine carboxypeptidase, partial [Glaciihabitans sp.]|nr:D-alanyl-D-alanine carboxypeptidase [Glaciihabitans sp.]
MSKKLTATVAGVVVLGVLVLGALVIVVTHMPSDSRIGAMVRDGSPSATGDVGINDGMIATGESISPFADDHPAIANLDADLRAAMQDAARDAISDG